MISLIGITGDDLKILIIFIKDRTYSVKIHNCISCKNNSLYRVPHGSTSDPLLCTIYISPLKYIIKQTLDDLYRLQIQ